MTHPWVRYLYGLPPPPAIVEEDPRKEIEKLRLTIGELQRRIDYYESKIREINAAVGDTHILSEFCPGCGTELGYGHKKGCIFL